MAEGPFIVLGGGPCGLAAAWQLCQLGAKPIVLEREPLVGGLCATHERDGWRFDLGGHRFVSDDVPLSRWLESLLGADLLVGERKSVVLYRGRRFRYPLEAVDLVRTLGVVENMDAFAGWVTARVRARLWPREERSFEDWVRARFGAPLYEAFFGPYTRKLWGIEPSLISADWAQERISLIDLRDVALRMMRLRTTPVRTYARHYRYPRLGMGQLYRAMGDEVVARGGEVRAGARVAGFETSGERVKAVLVEGPRGAERIPVGELVSTLPLPEFARASPGPSGGDRSRRRASSLSRAGVRQLDAFAPRLLRQHLDVRRERRADDVAHPGAQAPQSLHGARGAPSLMLEVPCDYGDRTWGASETDLRIRMLSELGALGMPVHDVLSSFVVRGPRLSRVSLGLRARPTGIARASSDLRQCAIRRAARPLPLRLHGRSDADGHEGGDANDRRRTRRRRDHASGARSTSSRRARSRHRVIERCAPFRSPPRCRRSEE